MILGGVITATLGWRWVFDINVPIGIVVSLLSIKYISNTRRQTYEHTENRHLDIFGAVLVTAGLMLLVYFLSSAQNIGIRSLQTQELLLSSVIVLAVFLLIEHRSKAPLIRLGFLRRTSVFGANAVGLLQFAAFVGMVFILSNYLQQVRRLLCAFSRTCISSWGPCIYSHFWIFVSTVGKSLRCQTNHNFRIGFADNGLSIAFIDLNHRKLHWWIARPHAPHRRLNWTRNNRNQHSRARWN